MSWLHAVNFFLLQWLGLRLAKVVELNGGSVSYWLIGPVLPLSGWWSDYIGRFRMLLEVSS